jgi:RNA polymerase primary sigma factor
MIKKLSGKDNPKLLQERDDFLRQLDPEVRLSELELKQAIDDVLRTLTPREKKVVILLFGLHDECPCTREEIAQAFAVTQERIRQIMVKAIRKLRQPSRSRRLRDFVVPRRN